MTMLNMTCQNTGAPNILRCTWRTHTQRFIQDDGRVIDHRDSTVSTSEAQSYAMVQAAWADDPEVFERVRSWTLVHLQDHNPHALPAWRWGMHPNHSWGVLSSQPSADADQWMAYALLLAADRWDRADYRRQALGMLHQIWAQEVRHHPAAGWLMLPGPWATADVSCINPSYFLPFAWRSFARADRTHPWSALLENSYRILTALMAGGHLPPDWAQWDPDTGGWVATGPFGYDACRIAWTLAAEARWHREPRAIALLSQMEVLQHRWMAHGHLPAEQDPETGAGGGDAHPGLYGALLPAWAVTNAHHAATLFQVELAARRTTHGWADADDAYGSSWTWMGIALWQGLASPSVHSPSSISTPSSVSAQS